MPNDYLTEEILALTFASIISALASASVVLTFLVFYQHLKRKKFFHLIFMLSSTEMIVSTTSAFGFPQSNAVLCKTQGFLLYFCVRAGWLWTTMLTHQIFRLVVLGDDGLPLYQMHMLVWSIALGLTLLPLSSGKGTTFGPSERMSGWCFVNYHESLWEVVTLVFPLITCVTLMAYFLTRIHWKLRDAMASTRVVVEATSHLKLYPIALTLLWTPFFVLNILDAAKSPYSSSIAVGITDICASQYGTLIAVIFFVRSGEAKARWSELLQSVKSHHFFGKNEFVEEKTPNGGTGVDTEMSEGRVVQSPSEDVLSSPSSRNWVNPLQHTAADSIPNMEPSFGVNVSQDLRLSTSSIDSRQSSLRFSRGFFFLSAFARRGSTMASFTTTRTLSTLGPGEGGEDASGTVSTEGQEDGWNSTGAGGGGEKGGVGGGVADQFRL